jgi:hypothetical protein
MSDWSIIDGAIQHHQNTLTLNYSVPVFHVCFDKINLVS